MKKPLRIAVSFVIIAVVLASAALFFLSRLRLDTYRDDLETALTGALGVEVTIARLSLSWTTGPVFVTDGLLIADPRLPGDYILYVPRVKTRLSLRSLFSDTLIVPSVSLSMPDVHLTEYRNGMNTWDLFAHTNNRDRLQATSDTLTDRSTEIIRNAVGVLIRRFKATDVIVERLTIDDGSFFYRHEENTGVVTSLVSSRGIDITLTSEGSPPIRGLLESPDPLSLIAGHTSGSVDHVDVNGMTFEIKSFTHTILNGVVTAKRLSVNAFDGSLTASGTMDIADPSFPVSLTLDVKDLAIHRFLNTFSDEKDLVVGAFTADGRFEFSARSLPVLVATLTGRGEYTIIDGYVTDFSIRKELADELNIPELFLPEELDTGAFDYLGGVYRVGDEKIWFDDSRVTAPTYTAAAHGFVGFDEHLDFSGDIYPSEEILDSTKLQRIAELAGNENLFRAIPFTVTGTFDDVEFAVNLNSPFLHLLLDTLEQFGIEF